MGTIQPRRSVDVAMLTRVALCLLCIISASAIPVDYQPTAISVEPDLTDLEDQTAIKTGEGFFKIKWPKSLSKQLADAVHNAPLVKEIKDAEQGLENAMTHFKKINAHRNDVAAQLKAAQSNYDAAKAQLAKALAMPTSSRNVFAAIGLTIARNAAVLAANAHVAIDQRALKHKQAAFAGLDLAYGAAKRAVAVHQAAVNVAKAKY